MKGGFVVGCRSYRKLDEKLKLEIQKEYLEGASCKELSERYTVSLSRLRDLVTDEKWLDKKRDLYRKSTEKLIEKISDELAKKRSKIASTVYDAASNLAEKAKNIISESENVYELAKASKLLKDACEILGIKSPDEMMLAEAQREKIEAETELAKSKINSDTDKDDGITFNINFQKANQLSS